MTQFSVQKVQGGFILQTHPDFGDTVLTIPTTEVFTSEAKLIKKIRDLLGAKPETDEKLLTE